MSFPSKSPKDHPSTAAKSCVDTLKKNPEKNPKKPSDMPTFNPNVKSKNKIEPYNVPSNYKTKIKIIP
ncbi:MAG: hypothetical protein ACFFCE_00045 [Promethearchaeota archaeon]